MTAEWKMVPVSEVAALERMIAIYDRVHGELDHGTPYEKIDNGLINGGETMPYEAWLSYMQQSIYLSAKSIVLSADSPSSPASGSDVGKRLDFWIRETERSWQLFLTGGEAQQLRSDIREAAALIARLEAENAEKTKALEHVRNYCTSLALRDLRETVKEALGER